MGVSDISPTQQVLTPADISRLVVASFGPEHTVADCAPLTGGGFAAVWRVTLTDARNVVVKVSPAAAVPLLSYEKGLLAAEARYFDLVRSRAPQVPVPRVLSVGRDCDALDGEWMFVSLLPGRSLAELSAEAPAADQSRVRADLGASYAALHAVTGDAFGYDGGRVSGAGWREVFTAMVGELLADAAAWDVDLGDLAERIGSVLERHGPVLGTVERPALLHFDGWDGNVLAVPGPDGSLRLSGLVDGERYLFGDPLMDFVSPALFRRIEDEPDHPFLRGYAKACGAQVELDGEARRRLALYRMHLYLLMTVELPSRGVLRDVQPERYEWILRLLRGQVRSLERGV